MLRLLEREYWISPSSGVARYQLSLSVNQYDFCRLVTFLNFRSCPLVHKALYFIVPRLVAYCFYYAIMVFPLAMYMRRSSLSPQHISCAFYDKCYLSPCDKRCSQLQKACFLVDDAELLSCGSLVLYFTPL